MDGRAASGLFPPGGRPPQAPERQGQKRSPKGNSKAPCGADGSYFFRSSGKQKKKAQRKNYGNASMASVTDTSRYHVEHLTTFAMDRKEGVLTVEDGVRKLKLLDARGKVWTQDMLLQVDEKAVSLIDEETRDELENFPLGSVQRSQALPGACSYDSVLALVCKEPGRSKPDLHLFQCDYVKAHLIHADIDSAVSDRKAGKVKKRPQVLRMISKSDGGGIIPPPPTAPAPDLPATRTNATSDPLAEWDAAPEPTDAAALDRDVQTLNRVLDDIEHFVARLQKAAEALDELSERKKRKKQKKGAGEGVLTLRAKPPRPEEFVDCFRKFKFAFNSLGKLRRCIQNPSALDLVHFLFTPLDVVIRAAGGVDLAKGVLSPLLTPEALDFLRSVVTPQERELWGSLGDGWTKSRAEWPKDQLQPPSPRLPRFRDDPQPPERAPVGRVRERGDARQRLKPEQPAAVQDFSSVRRKQEAQSGGKQKECVGSRSDFVASSHADLSALQDQTVEVPDDRKQRREVWNGSGASGYAPNGIPEEPYATDGDDGGIYTHTFQLMMPKKEFELFKQLLGELNEKQQSEPLPKPAADCAPAAVAAAATPPTRAPAHHDDAREQTRNGPPPSLGRGPGRKSGTEDVQDELGPGHASDKTGIPARHGGGGDGFSSAASITYDSSPEEVKAWLRVKGFGQATVDSLGVLTGAQLFSLSKEELKTACPDDGGRVYSQVAVRKAALESTSVSELQEIMRRRQEKLNPAACDSGAESFVEGSSAPSRSRE